MRRLDPGRQALLVVAHVRQGETYLDLAEGFSIGITTVCRYIREGLDVLAALAPTLAQTIELAQAKAFMILDGTLLAIDRVGMSGGHDRPFYSGRHKCHGLNVQVLADRPADWSGSHPRCPAPGTISPPPVSTASLPRSTRAGVRAVADTGYQGAGLAVAVPQIRRRCPVAGSVRRLYPRTARRGLSTRVFLGQYYPCRPRAPRRLFALPRPAAVALRGRLLSTPPTAGRPPPQAG
ncbi:transposase family protein [Pseudonocardia humida]|uniref:Transposase n=1 Tax=Pseudonocardia humida TaxID=2800819 RepID=A0ABT1A2X2_9PSEU|nr:transposase [Pseudonocardia humida]